MLQAANALLDSLSHPPEWFGFSADDPYLVLFAQRLTEVARAHGKTEVVDELRRRFVSQEADEAPVDGDTTPE